MAIEGIETVREIIGKNQKNSRQVRKEINSKSVLLGFHKPPFNSQSHLHLHVVYPESSIKNDQKRRVHGKGWTSIEHVIQSLQHK